MAAIAYTILLFSIIRHHGPDTPIAVAIGGDGKGQLSLMLYAASIIAALHVDPWVGLVLLFGPAVIWLVPDRRMEKAMSRS